MATGTISNKLVEPTPNGLHLYCWRDLATSTAHNGASILQASDPASAVPLNPTTNTKNTKKVGLEKIPQKNMTKKNPSMTQFLPSDQKAGKSNHLNYQLDLRHALLIDRHNY